MMRLGVFGAISSVASATRQAVHFSRLHTARTVQAAALGMRCHFDPPKMPKEAPAPREVETAKRLNMKTSPSKLNLVAKQVRGLRVKDAITQMKFSPKRASMHVEKVLHNAMHAAHHNKGLDMDNLYVAKAWVGKGTYLRRVRYHARGRGAWMHKRFAHLFVELQEGAPDKKKRSTRMQRKAMKIANARRMQVIRNSL